MYKIITIGGKDYKLEYSIEASLYGDCVASMTSMIASIGEAGSKDDIKRAIYEAGNIPSVALTVFYAGLLEAHGTHPEGDGTIPDMQTAKKLIVQYMKEHQNEEGGNFYDVLTMCVNQMGEDGFFVLTGMDAMISKGMEIAQPNRAQRRAQKKISAKSS